MNALSAGWRLSRSGRKPGRWPGGGAAGGDEPGWARTSLAPGPEPLAGVAAAAGLGLVAHPLATPAGPVADPVTTLALFMALGLLLLARGIKPASPLGDAPVSILLGVSVGLALVGAMRGTLLPQAAAAVRGPSLASTMPPWLGTASVLTMALATIVTLAAFYHQQRAHGLTGAIDRVFHALGAVGRRLVMVALGAVLAGAWVTFFAALQGRVAVVQRFVEQIIGLWSRAP